jgi:hypothetical protein
MTSDNIVKSCLSESFGEPTVRIWPVLTCFQIAPFRQSDTKIADALDFNQLIMWKKCHAEWSSRSYASNPQDGR